MIHIVISEPFQAPGNIKVFPCLDKALQYQQTCSSTTIVHSCSLYKPITYTGHVVDLVGYTANNNVVITTPDNGFEMLQVVPIEHTTAPYCNTTKRPLRRLIHESTYVTKNFTTCNELIKLPFFDTTKKPNTSPSSGGNWFTNLFWGKVKVD
jgi:hypothetical protein